MAGYNKGFETKKIILDTCRKLFYEQGIRSTTYAGISEKCGVLPGSILYHYKNVMEIAGILITEDRGALTEAVCGILHRKEQDMAVNIVVHLIHLYVFFRDEKYRKFHTEFELTYSQQSVDTGYPNMNMAFYREEFIRRNPEENSQLAVDFYYNASIGSGGRMNQFISMHIQEMTLKQAFKYCIDIYYCMFHYSSEELENLINKAFSVVDRLEITNDELRIMIREK